MLEAETSHTALSCFEADRAARLNGLGWMLRRDRVGIVIF